MDKYLNLANRLYEVIRGNLTCIETWGFYLFDYDFNGESELRNKIGTIWLCSLLDTLEAESRFIPQAIQEAESEGWESLAHNGRELQKLCKLTSELLDSFTREEQIFLLDLRNQWTHGYLANRHREKVSVKYAGKGKLHSEQLEHWKYAKIVSTFWEQGNIDKTLESIIARSLDKKHRYWTAVGVLQQKEEEIYRILRGGEIFNITV